MGGRQLSDLKYYQANRDKILENKKLKYVPYRLRTPEQKRQNDEATKRYLQTHPEQMDAHIRNNRARNAAASRYRQWCKLLRLIAVD